MKNTKAKWRKSMKKKVLYGIGGAIIFLILLIFIGVSSLYGKMNYQKSTEKSISDEEKKQYIKEEENQDLIDSEIGRAHV